MNATATQTTASVGAVRLLWGVAANVAVFSLTLLFALAAIVMTSLTRSTRCFDLLGPTWSRWILAICGVRIDVEGLENVDPKRSCVLISNHLSNFDVWATFAALPFNLRFVAKKELTRLPFFGRALAMSEHVIIDRSNPDEAIARINARVAARPDSGFCILFFAEGTRSPDGRIHAFKKGGVSLAIRTGLPIIPVTVSGTWKLLPKGAWVIRPGGRVKVVLDRPIETTGIHLDDRDALNERVRAIVVRNFSEAY
ncbi:MAG: 1-acyl-sn-glycerol-3-phosphate acyltransferase [Deltaproteobacteria bacterium]|nr:1-acyl-sn-glycerol-3-phosphate acyltransferase [Deltaproteobacteria bacterium]